MQQDVAGVGAFLQEHHRPAVVGSGSSCHHRQLALLGQTTARVQGKAWTIAMEARLLLEAVTGFL